MVMTILEGRVTKNNWQVLERAYEAASQSQEPGLVQSFLIQDSRDHELWRILTLWTSQEALDAMRAAKETPRGVLIFREAGAEPQLSINKVYQQIPPKQAKVKPDRNPGLQ